MRKTTALIATVFLVATANATPPPLSLMPKKSLY